MGSTEPSPVSVSIGHVHDVMSVARLGPTILAERSDQMQKNLMRCLTDKRRCCSMVFLAKNPRGEMRGPLFGNRLIAKITPMGGLIAEPHYNNALVYGVLRATTSVQKRAQWSQGTDPPACDCRFHFLHCSPLLK